MSRLTSLGVLAWYFISLVTIFLSPGIARAENNINYSGGNVSGEVEEVISLAGITISSDDPTVPMTLSVERGILSMTTTTGLAFSTSTSGSTLSFTGSVADINAALATLQYRTLNAETVEFTASIIDDGDVYFPGNGHFYEIVDSGGGITANDARAAAALLTKNGATGYLATITTQAEYDYISDRLSGDGWFGAADDTTEGDWQWVTGPEAGTSFWSGLGDGASVGGLFSNWASGEPNDAGGEDCGQFYSGGGGWNDLPCDGVTLSYYVVEYGADGDLPTAPPSVSFDITTTYPTAQNINIGSCLDLIDVYDNGADNRYDNLLLTSDIDCTGEDLEPMFAQTDPDFGNIGFRGTFDGQGNSITGATLSNGSDSSVGIFAFTNGATIRNVSLIGGESTGDSCVGGLVGTATDTTFESITTNMPVSGNYYVGGLVGCYRGEVTAHTISASSVSGTMTGQEEVAGLIGSLEMEDSGELTLTGNTFSGEFSSVYSMVGGLVGSIDQEDDSATTMTLNTVGGVNMPDTEYVGGLVGYATTDDSATLHFENNSVTGAVAGDASVGGLAGEAHEDSGSSEITIENTTVAVDVSSDDGDEVGGLVGYASGVSISSSSVSGDVTGGDDEVGGLVGEAYNLEIVESYTTGDVTADDSLAGGLTGRNSQTNITRSYALGNVTGDDRVGGLVGANGGEITDSYARGNVTGDSEVGGLAGRCGNEITNSYATGAVTGLSDAGGLLGYSDGCDVENSFWDKETTTQEESAEGTGKTTAEMKVKATYTDNDSEGLEEPWDFASTWKINEDVNDGYPCLAWQSDDCVLVDDDEDGVSSAVESAAPNSGDANNDGTPDSAQPHVSSFVNPITTAYTTVALNADCTLTEAKAEAESGNSVADSGYNYGAGLVNFAANCGTPGYTTTVTIYQYGTSGSLTVRKYNPNTNAYFTVTDAVLATQTIGGQTVTSATFSITDGGALDMDGTVNGEIVDPVGLASLVVGAPNTGLGGSAR